ncbi:hypothetical protein E3N88_33847 [Mikania micrantha]|uniref:Uncharacterized protein n=1 Tax=Mikania micrantha TaxID=192012 RepID=A0A5N6MD42_9ASTR|nr:hypothetical protein E3N88_33847 [Mikania micrantha]
MLKRTLGFAGTMQSVMFLMNFQVRPRPYFFSKTEYLCCNFSGTNGEEDEDHQVTIGGQEVPQTTKFKYLGSFDQSDGDIDCDVAHRVQAGWNRWRAATSILCDKRFPDKLKGKFYRVAVRLAMLYESDCWPIKKTQERKLDTTEMRMLRWMCGLGPGCRTMGLSSLLGQGSGLGPNPMRLGHSDDVRPNEVWAWLCVACLTSVEWHQWPKGGDWTNDGYRTGRMRPFDLGHTPLIRPPWFIR